jgi:hypothetical protein
MADALEATEALVFGSGLLTACLESDFVAGFAGADLAALLASTFAPDRALDLTGFLEF